MHLDLLVHLVVGVASVDEKGVSIYYWRSVTAVMQLLGRTLGDFLKIGDDTSSQSSFTILLFIQFDVIAVTDVTAAQVYRNITRK